ncbi:MAG: CYTH domain-containing protein [Planctomycetota bacterium]
MAHEELEFKFRVEDAAALARLDAALRGPGAPPLPVVRQVNRFFDTAGRALGRAEQILRLREEEGRFVLTAKGPGAPAEEGPLAVHAEEEVAIAPREAEAIQAGLLSPLLLLLERTGIPVPPLLEAMARDAGDEELVEVGSFTNERRRLGPLPLPGSSLAVLFELDRTSFPGGEVHCEIEVELPSPAAAAAARAPLFALLAAAGIPWRPSTPKASRFFAILSRRGG